MAKEKFLILLIVYCFGSNSGYSFFQEEDTQKIAINVDGVSIKQFIEEVQNKTTFVFFYNDELIDTGKRVTLDMEENYIGNILDAAFMGTKISYTIKGKQVILTPKVLEEIIVRGNVVDESGVPLAGVTVIDASDRLKGTQTDFDGNYQITVIEGSKLIFSFLGMKKVTKNTGKEFLNVTMEAEVTQLGDIVLTGYQDINKKVFTGASRTITPKDIDVGGIVDVARMMEGRAAGVSVQNVSGTFGTSPKVTIRGGASIFGDTEPLWVVDGAVQEEIIELTFEQLTSGDSSTLLSSAITGLNANDIESIEILKDASALSLYGARALNGAVIITTKKGKKNTKSSVSYRGEYSVRSIPRYAEFNLMNSYETLSVYKELEEKGFLDMETTIQGRYAGIYNIMHRTINTYDPKTETFLLENTPEARNKFLWKYGMANTDWFKVLFKSLLTQNHTLSFSGGSDTGTYYGSIGYYTDSGWTIADKLDRVTGSIRNTYNISDKVSAGIIFQSSIREQKAPGSYNRNVDVVHGGYTRLFEINPFSYALNTSRTLRPYDDTNENQEYYRYNWAPFNILNELENNILNVEVIDLKLQGDLNVGLGNNLDYTFLGSIRYVKSTKEHNIKEGSNVVAAYRANETPLVMDENFFLYRDSNDPNALPEVVLQNGGIYNREDDNLRSFYFRNTFEFSEKYNGKHDIGLYFGQEYRHTDRMNSFFTGFGYQFDRGGIPFSNYKIIQKNITEGDDYFGRSEDKERGIAFFAKGTYAFDNKYILSITGNYEGSNKLGPDINARWLPTWNVSGKWNLLNEPFFKRKGSISNLSIRAGYGLVAGLGSASNALAIFRSAITSRFDPNDRESSIEINELQNRELTWEKQYEFNIGVDASFIKGTSFTLDVYNKKSYDLIDRVSTSGIGGQHKKLANNADMVTKGIELTLFVPNIKTDDFKWDTTLNFSIFDQKVTRIENSPEVFDLVKDTGGNVEGRSRSSLYSFDFSGLDSSGLPMFNFVDDRDPVTGINFQEEEGILNYLKYEGSVEPNIFGGLSNVFSYKDWELEFFLSMQAGNKIRLTPIYKGIYDDLSVFPKEFGNRWQVQGDENKTRIPAIIPKSMLDNNDIRRLDKVYNAYNYSTERVADGSFVRMKNISLSYSFPEKVVRKLNVKNFKIGFHATNPFLIYSDPKLNGQDPEFFRTGGVAYPVTKNYTLELNLTL